ncbi:MAG TPA: hypothetical protein VGR78_09370 [Verrucomicrobiae bacterium]|jgi:hypothetical protein|nr:hypothetical protein [Verrucomicrobiae bacterium]
MNAKIIGAIGAAVAILLLTACTTNNGYKSADFSGNKVYKKGHVGPQLKENDVLGLRATDKVTDREISRVLDETRTISLRRGSTVLVVQSGARHPDKEMSDALSADFTIIPYSGVPSELCSEDEDVSKALRLAAAHSKAETILVYWGHLELKRDEMPTGIVSWVPVVDFMVPDEYQKMRMYLKIALIDVRTGQWATFRTEPIEDQTLTTRYAREHEQKWPMQGVKQRLYQASVRQLMDGYVVASN